MLTLELFSFSIYTYSDCVLLNLDLYFTLKVPMEVSNHISEIFLLNNNCNKNFFSSKTNPNSIGLRTNLYYTIFFSFCI